jgi:hypothetical protein
MLHPHTELRFVSEEIGYGIFATHDIPLGTITWVRDELDRVFKKEEVLLLTSANLENLLKYTYRDRHGNYVFCWDLTRYVNHSYAPNSMITPLGFEVAIRDITRGDELTNDYGTLNIIEPFKCALGDHEREFVRPDDLTRFHPEWDALLARAFERSPMVAQPLTRFLSGEQQEWLRRIHAGEEVPPSILEILYAETVTP